MNKGVTEKKETAASPQAFTGPGPGGISCGTCVFVDMRNQADIFCRRYPTNLVILESKVRQFYPSVSPTADWCGEHSAGQETAPDKAS